MCDVSDEEVHFSRGALAGSYPFTQLTIEEQNYNRQLKFNFADLSQRSNEASSNEQAKSSRLLNAIGSKLKRSSNYLAAPRLVGQYLLGITIQSWPEFLNTSRMMRAPTTRHQLTRRILTNLSHFQGNYLCVSLILVVYCILTSPLLLIAIIAYVLALYVITARSATGKHLRIAGYRPNLHQQYSFTTLISLPLLWVAGAPSAVFWVIGASFVVVGLHAAMYSGEEEPTLQLVEHQPYGRLNYAQVAPVHPQYLASLQHPAAPAQPSPPTTYSRAISQWITFGSSKQSSDEQASGCSKTHEVKIISHDYAGLGRVYEV